MALEEDLVNMAKQRPEVAIVVAVAKNRIIGGGNSLLWNLPNDLAHFKNLTMGYPVIMGRKTYQSIGKKLPGRQMIVISRNADFEAAGCMIAGSLEEAISFAEGADTVFVCGGGQIYAEALPIADVLYVTEVDMDPEGDTYFSYSPSLWREVERQDFERDEQHQCDYSFCTLRRITSAP